MEDILLKIILIIGVIVLIMFLIGAIVTFIVEPIKERKELKKEASERIKNEEKRNYEIEKNLTNEVIRDVERLKKIVNHLTKDKDILVYEKKFGCVSNECVSNECVSNEKEKDVCSPENYYRVAELKSGIEFVLDEELNLKTPVTRIDLVEKAKKMILKEENYKNE